jgi:lysophospholipase L1-like esterase
MSFVAGSRTGRRLAAEKRWTGVLRAKLKAGYNVIEVGLNGRTTVFDDPDSPFRSGEDYLPPCLASHASMDLVIIMLGTNDLKDKFGLRPEDIAAGMEKLISIVRRSGAGISGGSPNILLTCPPHTARATAYDDFLHSYSNSTRLSGLYASLAKKYGCLYLDASEFIHESDLPDGIHLSETVHGALGERAAKMVVEILG